MGAPADRELLRDLVLGLVFQHEALKRPALVVVNDAVDTPEEQTARDSSECDVLDGIDLDGNDEFFDCIECSDLNSNDEDLTFGASSDKENCN